MMKGEPGTVLKAWQKMAMVLSKDLGNTKSAKPTQKAQRKTPIDLCFLRLFLCAFCVPCLHHPLYLIPLGSKNQPRRCDAAPPGIVGDDPVGDEPQDELVLSRFEFPAARQTPNVAL